VSLVQDIDCLLECLYSCSTRTIHQFLFISCTYINVHIKAECQNESDVVVERLMDPVIFSIRMFMNCICISIYSHILRILVL